MKTPNLKNYNKIHEEEADLQKREIEKRLRHIKNKIIVISGKGCVGKRGIAAYLS